MNTLAHTLIRVCQDSIRTREAIIVLSVAQLRFGAIRLARNRTTGDNVQTHCMCLSFTVHDCEPTQ